MARRLRLLVLLLTLCLVACGGEAGTDTTGEPESEQVEPEAVEDNGDFLLVMDPPAPADQPVAELVQSSGAAQDSVDGLNELLALPEDITIHFTADDPDELGPHFNPETNTIAFPFPSLTLDREAFRSIGYETDEELDDALLGDILFTIYHEVGHALIANLGLPVTGKEEDAVDSLSAVLLIDTYEDGQDLLISAADWFAALFNSREEAYGFSDFADEHSLSEQRYISLLCLAYGSDPEAYSELVDPEFVPEERAEDCEFEYQQAADSWHTLLEPHQL